MTARHEIALFASLLLFVSNGCEDQERVDASKPEVMVPLTTEFPVGQTESCWRREIPALPGLVPRQREAPSLLVPEGTELLSLAKAVTSSDEEWPIIGEFEQITDGMKGWDFDCVVEISPGLQWLLRLRTVLSGG